MQKILNLMGHCEKSAKKEVHTTLCLHKNLEEISQWHINSILEISRGILFLFWAWQNLESHQRENLNWSSWANWSVTKVVRECFVWWLTDMGGLSLQWPTPSLGKWAWAASESQWLWQKTVLLPGFCLKFLFLVVLTSICDKLCPRSYALK